jgi:hypothetical protein
MKHLLSFILGCLILAGSAAPGQDRPKPVSLIQLISVPEKFDGKLVTLSGFLVLGERPEFFGQQPVLYVHQEDAKNLLVANSVWVVPSTQMRRDQEKLNLMYVTLTGVFHAAHGGDHEAYEGGTIAQIQACVPWSDPNHPIGLREDKGKYK